MNRRSLFGFLGGLGIAAASGKVLASAVQPDRVLGAGQFVGNGPMRIVTHDMGHVPSVSGLTSYDGTFSVDCSKSVFSIAA